MSTRATSDRRTAVQGGLLMFAGIIMIVGGLYHAFLGLAGIFRDQVYVTTPGYIYTFDLTGWGWAHLLLGILVVAAGVAILQGTTWGRVVGMALAALSMLANFLFIPYYPLWSVVIIALDVAVIWALVTAPREV